MLATRLFNRGQICKAAGLNKAKGYGFFLSVLPDFVDQKGAPLFLETRLPEIMARLEELKNIHTNTSEITPTIEN